jgi:predicted nucleotidyltransferase
VDILIKREKLASWCRANNVDLCILFGSQATGKTHARSDWDIAVLSLTNHELQRQWLRINGELEDLFGQAIDLAILDQNSDPVLRLEVFQNGKALYESIPGLFTEQHILAVKFYDDTIPLRRLRDKVLAQRILNLKYVDEKKYASRSPQKQN